jgi:hypothetical protein
MKQLTLLLFILMFTISLLGQSYDQEISYIKGHPIRVELVYKKSLLHPNSAFKCIYTCFNSGKIKTQQLYLGGKLKAEYHYAYDSVGREVSSKCFQILNHTDSVETFRTVYLLDKNNRIQSEKLEFRHNKPVWIKDSIEYNYLNMPISYKKTFPPYDSEGKATLENYILSYNEIGLVSKIEMTTKNGGYENTEYWYNENRDISIVETENCIDSLSNQTIIGKPIITFDKQKLQYSYNYDMLGNWIKIYTIADNSKKQLKIKRIITYEK